MELYDKLKENLQQKTDMYHLAKQAYEIKPIGTARNLLDQCEEDMIEAERMLKFSESGE